MGSDENTSKYALLGKRIERLRKAQGLNQVQLAEKLGISKSAINNWEKGHNRPSADKLEDLCVALNVSPSELLDIHLAPEEYTREERAVITAYRNNPELQIAVRRVLGIDE